MMSILMMMIKTLVKDKPYVAELAATVAVLKKKKKPASRSLPLFHVTCIAKNISLIEEQEPEVAAICQPGSHIYISYHLGLFSNSNLNLQSLFIYLL